MKEENKAEEFYFPPDNTTCTKTFWQFLSDYKETLNVFFFTLHLAHHADESSDRAAKALISGSRTEEERARLQTTIDNPHRMAKQLQKFSTINSKNISTNISDSFLWYISNIIQQAIKRKPEIIKSGESVKIEDIFNYPSRRELINYLIDRKINSLSYGGMRQIEKFLADAFGLELFSSERDRNLLRIFVEIRNIQAHNRGVVNRIFLDRVGESLSSFHFDFREGQRVHLGFDDLCVLSKVCITTALELDSKFSLKFGIERKRISTWLKQK